MKSRFFGAAAIACGVGLLPAPSFAHHSVASEFDTKNCRDFTGTLTSVSWENPHMHFNLDIKDASGKVESWTFQGYSTLTMTRAGSPRQDFMENMGKEVWVQRMSCPQRDDAQSRRGDIEVCRRPRSPGWPAAGRGAIT